MIVLYDLYEFGELVYVGITNNPKRRKVDHVIKGKIGQDAEMRTVARFRSPARAANAEKKRILELRPRLNVAYLEAREKESDHVRMRRKYERFQRQSAVFLKSRIKAERAMRAYYQNEKPKLPAWF